ncbi:peptide/nickel transport system permease protein [Microbacterium sp. AG1240]|uniref:ABC transporter permease n=1 Tax=Microbacterium sp. AG1240 TaxID=2183992 RepID=UPI000EB25465|nr:ABC transporter permease [Microbacterium sp. AG1240]RKT36081.1 peptide/nickel transport system permease protein [Microbacterium sp. AG1240]
MLKFVLKRVGSGVVLLFVISCLTYSFLMLSGPGIARTILGQRATEEQVALKATELGLDRPFFERFLGWLTDALQGDLGRSWFSGEVVSSAIATRLPVTLSLVIGTTIVAAVVSVVLGVAAAVRRGWLDRVLQVVIVLGFALPGFWLALMLVRFFAIDLRLFPATGFVPITTSFPGWLSTVTLPITALVIGGIAGIAQQVRSSVIGTLRQDYVRTLYSRGLSPVRVIGKHVLRNASGPALTVLALQFVGLLGGAVIVEQIFALPGLGLLAVTATTRGDIPIVMGVVVVTAVLVVIVNLTMDILNGWLNPKARIA